MLDITPRLDAWRGLRDRRLLARYFAGRLLVATGLSRWLFIPRDGYRLRFFPSALSLTLWVDPHERCEDETFFRQYLMAGDTAIDVGANIGSLTLAAAGAVGRTGRVVALEAHPRTFQYLRANVRLNEAAHVELHNVAAGSTRGRVAFSDGRLDDQNRVGLCAHGVEVPVFPLDDLVGDATRVALLKIDVEGYEQPVLEGAARLLGRTDAVLFESADAQFRKYGYTTPDVLRLLNRHGFDLFRMPAPGTFEPISDSYASPRCENLLALRERARARLVQCQRAAAAS